MSKSEFKSQKSIRVEALPGDLDSSSVVDLPFKSYAGYINVDESRGNNLFYWFFESALSFHSKAEDIPLIVWLNGGPGVSSLVGLFLENGPVSIGRDGARNLTFNRFSWNKSAHVLYIDQPVGTGYSYTTNNGYVRTEKELSRQVAAALNGFFECHPKYRNCPLFITGESYAGKYIPHIACEIDEQNQDAEKAKQISLSGIAVGNGWIEPKVQIFAQVDSAFAYGLIDTRTRDEGLALCEKCCDLLGRGNLKEAAACSSGILDMIGACAGPVFLEDVATCNQVVTASLVVYLQMPAVKAALGVPQDVSWLPGPVAEYLEEDMMKSAVPQLQSVIERRPVLIYTGTLDVTCGYLGAEKILENLKWSGAAQWRNAKRRIWSVPTDAAATSAPSGYIKSSGNLTQVVIPYSGHMVPYYRPAVAREMIYDWIFRGSRM